MASAREGQAPCSACNTAGHVSQHLLRTKGVTPQRLQLLLNAWLSGIFQIEDLPISAKGLLLYRVNLLGPFFDEGKVDLGALRASRLHKAGYANLGHMLVYAVAGGGPAQHRALPKVVPQSAPNAWLLPKSLPRLLPTPVCPDAYRRLLGRPFC